MNDPLDILLKQPISEALTGVFNPVEMSAIKTAPMGVSIEQYIRNLVRSDMEADGLWPEVCVDEWKLIPDHSLYEMNACGDVRNRETLRTKRPHYNKDGGKIINLYCDLPGVRARNLSVAKLVMRLFGHPCPPDRIPLIELIDDDPRNTCISNLRWQVPSPEMTARAQRYNNPPLKKKPGHKFKIDPLKVLSLYDAGAVAGEDNRELVNRLAKQFQVTDTTIYAVVRRYRKGY